MWTEMWRTVYCFAFAVFLVWCKRDLLRNNTNEWSVWDFGMKKIVLESVVRIHGLRSVLVQFVCLSSEVFGNLLVFFFKYIKLKIRSMSTCLFDSSRVLFSMKFAINTTLSNKKVKRVVHTWFAWNSHV